MKWRVGVAVQAQSWTRLAYRAATRAAMLPLFCRSRFELHSELQVEPTTPPPPR
jgi:hypothetical protein